ncbi:hypothetical protein HWV62_34139 [Athelia sp. TMB]|nr:hypothetical protein HWV62_34139 [Athelia sp. TMB]
MENKIPEFDNLYLDFNAIIHNCSHPNDGDAHFRLSEEQMFTSIFSYVDMLFGKIKPKKLFFIAVDGVAPRAKMNQQRSRRFRTAKEAQELKDKALRNGEKLPDEKAFDSNSITPGEKFSSLVVHIYPPAGLFPLYIPTILHLVEPCPDAFAGTPFMTRVASQMQYFINKKISEDSAWRSVTVVLSGHDVPGEGEHKIMEYIRKSRAQPDYDPNVRHCLYGLDADLIMLGLLSHDPHFCLLREEVKFGPAKKGKGGGGLDQINFYLLHLSLMREYLDLEFNSIRSVLPFDYSAERVIDDFILLAVFVGNDFLPNLPDLHIHENGLERLFEVYKKVLPSLDGYINEAGTINVKRLQSILDEMALWERDVFEKEFSDLSWYKGKQREKGGKGKTKEVESAKKQEGLVLMKPQRAIFDAVNNFILSNRDKPAAHIRTASLSMPNTFAARERKFIATLAEDLKLSVSWDEYDDDDQNLIVWRLPGALDEPLPDPISDVPEEDDSEEVWEDVEEDVEEEDEEGKAAVDRVLKKYATARVVDEATEGGGFDARHQASVMEKMDEWKRGYYRGKLEISYDDPKEMGDLVYKYIEGLQMTFYFPLGKPFRPYEQLMGVMPAASREVIPTAYHDLMLDPNSPILDFYPPEFELDLNGKKQDWEAIVKIPFIDEQRLLKAMATREHRLSPAEVSRNGFGVSFSFSFNPGEPTVYPSSLPGFFPPLYRCTCVMVPFDLPVLDGLHLVPGLCDGVKIGAEALAGFPSLYSLPNTAMLGFHGVNVHGTESRNKSMIVHIQNPHEDKKTETIAQEMIGKRTFVGWPFLQEGLVVAVSDSLFKYEKMTVVPGAPAKVISNPHAPNGLGHWKSKAERIESHYSKKLGVITGDVDVLLHVRPLKGLKRLDTGALVKDYEGQEKEIEQAVQMTLPQVVSEDPRFLEKEAPALSEEFPDGSKIFFLGEHAYGVAAQVSATTATTLYVVLAFFPSDKAENEKFKSIVDSRISSRYFPSFKAAELVGITTRGLSKITSSFMVLTAGGKKENVGLSLKFEAKALKVIDYSRKNDRFWEFSQKTIDLLRDYKAKFPQIFRRLDGGGDDMVRASDVFDDDADSKVQEVKTWLKNRGVRDFEPVSLFADQLNKETVGEIEKIADAVTANKSQSAIKKAIVKGIPRQAVLKPAHAVYRLQHQRFALGDRVTMVQDSGGVPLSVKGVVIGLNSKSMDVVWDVPFMAGVTLGDRCSQYRGSTVEFDSCLNLTNPQFIASTNPKAPAAAAPTTPFKPKTGPYPVVRPAPGQAPASGFRPGPPKQAPFFFKAFVSLSLFLRSTNNPVHIMANPNRGRGSFPVRGGTPQQTTRAPAVTVVAAEETPKVESSEPALPNLHTNGGAQTNILPRGGGRGGGAPREEEADLGLMLIVEEEVVAEDSEPGVGV